MDGLSHHLKSIHPTIKFTMDTKDMKEGGSLPFFDTKITRKADGKIEITVYCKNGQVPTLSVSPSNIWDLL